VTVPVPIALEGLPATEGDDARIETSGSLNSSSGFRPRNRGRQTARKNHMRTMLLKTVVFGFAVMAASTALAQSTSSPAADRSTPNSETRGSSDRWDYPGYVYGPKSVNQDDTSLRSSAAMSGTTGQNESRNNGNCDLSTHLNVAGGGCVELGPD
jgi:hypothetical protein